MLNTFLGSEHLNIAIYVELHIEQEQYNSRILIALLFVSSHYKWGLFSWKYRLKT